MYTLSVPEKERLFIKVKLFNAFLENETIYDIEKKYLLVRILVRILVRTEEYLVQAS